MKTLIRVALGLVTTTIAAQGGLSVTLEKIAEVATPVDFGSQLGAPFVSGGSIYYSRSDRSQDSSLWGIYRDGSQIASWGGEISGSTVTNLGVSDTSQSSVLIGAGSNSGHVSPNRFTATLNTSSGGAPTEILSILTQFPGYPEIRERHMIGSGTVDGNMVAFMIQEDQFANPRLPTALAITDLSGTSVTLIAEEGDPVPDGGGTFREFETFTKPYADGGRVVFVGDGTSKRGIYEWTGSGLRTIVDSSAARPEGGTLSWSFQEGSVIKDGSHYAFVEGSSSSSLYKIIDGELSLVGNRSNDVPGGTGVFFNYFSPSLRNGNVVFLAGRNSQFSPPKELGIYTDISGSIEPIVDIRTDFDGKEIDSFDLALGSAWASDNSIYFKVDFTDNTAAIYRATFTTEADSLPSEVAFTGERSGSITVQTRAGFSYQLRRMTDLSTTGSIVSTVSGTGGAMAIQFNETDLATKRAFFRVEEVAD